MLNAACAPAAGVAYVLSSAALSQAPMATADVPRRRIDSGFRPTELGIATKKEGLSCGSNQDKGTAAGVATETGLDALPEQSVTTAAAHAATLLSTECMDQLLPEFDETSTAHAGVAESMLSV
jgi:hypothetical protein